MWKRTEKKARRLWELDFLRGIALILMVYYHVIYDLKEFYQYPIDYENLPNTIIGKSSAMLFMVLAGISSSLSGSNLKRGLKLLGISLLITLGTHLYDPALGIKFGIIHFLAVCVLLSPWLMKLNNILLLLLAALMVYLGQLIPYIRVTHDYLFVFGLSTPAFTSSDYYPLIPWIAVFILGLVLGKTLYKERKSLVPFTLPDNAVSFIGRHTLSIYLLHQQAILLVLVAVDKLLH